MHARKPGLLHHLIGGVALRLPQRRHERLAALVQRQRLIAVTHMAAQRHVVKLVERFGPEAQRGDGYAQGAHRIPDADEFDGRVRPGVGLAKGDGLRRVGVAVGRTVAIERVGLAHAADMLRTQNAAIANQPAHAAHRVRAAAVTEQKDLVARVIVLHQKQVKLADIGRDPQAKRAPGDFVPQAALFAQTFLVEHRLIDAMTVLRRDGDRELDHIGRRGRVTVVLVGLAPGAVGEEGDAFHVRNPQRCYVFSRLNLTNDGAAHAACPPPNPVSRRASIGGDRLALDKRFLFAHDPSPSHRLGRRSATRARDTVCSGWRDYFAPLHPPLSAHSGAARHYRDHPASGCARAVGHQHPALAGACAHRRGAGAPVSPHPCGV